MEATLGAWGISVKHTPPSGIELAAMYDEAAKRWHNRLALLGYPRAYEDLFDRLLATGTLHAPPDGGRVLDCRVGMAAFSLALARKVITPLRIEGVDLSPSMLLRACINLYRAGIENRMHLRDVKALPFEDGTFDAVIGAHALEHLDDPFAGHFEMSRVLKPGAPMVVVASRRSIPDALSCLEGRHKRTERYRLELGMESAGLTGILAYPLLVGEPKDHQPSFACVGFKKEVSL